MAALTYNAGVRCAAVVVAFSIQMVAACAPRIAMHAPSQLLAADADAALLRGCYDCLIDAREIYRKLPDRGGAAHWVFETDLLIALREKEIRLIARGEPNDCSGYYRRARNLHALGQLDDARRDVSAAKELGGSEDLLLLAGTIEYEQGDLDVAQADLAIVIGADAVRSVCEARWYLGLVDRQRKRWSSARHTLEDANDLLPAARTNECRPAPILAGPQ
jgi:tetratricopeptide (TPR) repeat protein